MPWWLPGRVSLKYQLPRSTYNFRRINQLDWTKESLAEEIKHIFYSKMPLRKFDLM